MKKLIFILILFSMITCIRNPTALVEPYFNPNDLDKLELENLENFWQGDTVEIWINPIPYIREYEGFLKSMDFRCDLKGIGIFVFKTQVIAVNLLGDWNSFSNSILLEGDTHDVIEEKWWYIKGDPMSTILVNKFNTILMLHNYYMNKNDLMNTAIEITDRIDRLSRS